MNKLSFKQIILISIIGLAFFLRFWNLGNVPPSPSMDESSIGYNAYSVLKTGKDEYGEFPLISQRSYDDWRRSTYLFMVVPFVGLFGANAVSVRLPAAILSVLTVLASCNIILLLFSKSKFAQPIALATTFLLAISPWHVYISRIGHESNAYLSFLVFGVLFFLLGLKNKTKLLISMIFFILSMMSYYSGQVFIPLFVLGLILIFWKNLLSIIFSDRKTIIAFVILVLLTIPIFWSIFSPNALVRFQGTSTFKPESHPQLFSERVNLRNKAVENKDLVNSIIYSRHIFPIVVLAQGYISHFRIDWLFENKSSDSFKAPNVGLLYAWESIFIIIGIFVLILSKEIDPKFKKLIFLWFFLAPLPASIATQAPHAMRSYNFLPTWQIFTALGMIYVFYRLRKIKALVLVIFIVVVSFGLINFYKNYFITFPKEQSNSFHYALAKTIPYVISQESRYKKVVFSNQNNLYQSYMLFLFHTRYDPSLYQKLGGTVSGGFDETHKFGKYEFRPIIWNKDKLLANTLFVGNVSDFPGKIIPRKSFSNIDGKGLIQVVDKMR